MNEDKIPKDLKYSETFEQIEQSIKILKEFFNNSTNKKLSLKIISQKKPVRGQIINAILEKPYPNQTEIKENIELNIDAGQLSKRLKKMVDARILGELDMLKDHLKLKSKIKKTYDLNRVTYHLLNSINKISMDLNNLKPLREEGLLDYKLGLLKMGLYDDMDDIKIIDARTTGGKLEKKIILKIKCNKETCFIDSCKRGFLCIFEDISKYFQLKIWNLNNINQRPHIKSVENCEIILNFPLEDLTNVL